MAYDLQRLMEYTIEGEAGSTLAIHVIGPVDVHDFLGLLDAVVASPHWLPGKHVLVDCRDADFSMVLVLDVHTMVKAFRQLDAQIGRGRMVLVVASSVEYGLVRMFQQLLHGQVKLEIAVFLQLDDARAWLAR